MLLCISLSCIRQSPSTASPTEKTEDRNLGRGQRQEMGREERQGWLDTWWQVREKEREVWSERGHQECYSGHCRGGMAEISRPPSKAVQFFFPPTLVLCPLSLDAELKWGESSEQKQGSLPLLGC